MICYLLRKPFFKTESKELLCIDHFSALCLYLPHCIVCQGVYHLKKAALFNINELGYVFTPFFEGVWDKRLEYLLELPKAKVVFHCEKTDIFKAKEVLGGHMCIQGGVPPTLLECGSPQEVEEHCKKLIKVVGKGGGFILGAGSSIDCAKPANIKAMVDSVKKYGAN